MNSKPHVIFYTRKGCHLCDEAREQIRQAACTDAYIYEEIDIDRDPTLVRRYGWDVPVVAINGVLTFKHRLTADDFKREIRNPRRNATDERTS